MTSHAERTCRTATAFRRRIRPAPRRRLDSTAVRALGAGLPAVRGDLDGPGRPYGATFLTGRQLCEAPKA
ncbi:hypothetical protein ACPF8X_28855 [Streptomyces sp. G35A]